MKLKCAWNKAMSNNPAMYQFIYDLKEATKAALIIISSSISFMLYIALSIYLVRYGNFIALIPTIVILISFFIYNSYNIFKAFIKDFIKFYKEC